MDDPFVEVLWPYPLQVQVKLARPPLSNQLVAGPILRFEKSVVEKIFSRRIRCVHLGRLAPECRTVAGNHELVVMQVCVFKHPQLRSFAAFGICLVPFGSRWVVRASPVRGTRKFSQVCCCCHFLRTLRRAHRQCLEGSSRRDAYIFDMLANNVSRWGSLLKRWKRIWAWYSAPQRGTMSLLLVWGGRWHSVLLQDLGKPHPPCVRKSFIP